MCVLKNGLESWLKKKKMKFLRDMVGKIKISSKKFYNKKTPIRLCTIGQNWNVDKVGLGTYRECQVIFAEEIFCLNVKI